MLLTSIWTSPHTLTNATLNQDMGLKNPTFLPPILIFSSFLPLAWRELFTDLAHHPTLETLYECIVFTERIKLDRKQGGFKVSVEAAVWTSALTGCWTNATYWTILYTCNLLARALVTTQLSQSSSECLKFTLKSLKVGYPLIAFLMLQYSRALLPCIAVWSAACSIVGLLPFIFFNQRAVTEHLNLQNFAFTTHQLSRWY